MNPIEVLLVFFENLVKLECSGTDFSHCPGSVLHPITAALATQGYWVHADILWNMTYTGMQLWAVFIYVIATMAGITGMAFGSPPKLWLWFLIGPGIFLFLLDTSTPTKGVRWFVGGESIDENTLRLDNANRQVWKLAEAGLANTKIARTGFTITANRAPEGGGNWGRKSGDPSGTVRVSWVMLWLDMLISDTVEWLISWTGVFEGGVPASFNAILNGESNLPVASLYNATGLNVATGGADTTRSDDQSWILSQSKWGYLQDITGATIFSSDLRGAFATFMVSECGDALSRSIDEGSYVAAQNARGMNLPSSVFLGGGSLGGSRYSQATKNLAIQSIPTPPEIKNLLIKDTVGSFRNSNGTLQGRLSTLLDGGILDNINCDNFLQILVDGFRWEASHAYYQMITSLPPGVSPLTLMYTLFYGWSIRDNSITGGVGLLDGFIQQFVPWNANNWFGLYNARPMSRAEDQAEFLTNLIFVHLVRNELRYVPPSHDVRYSESKQITREVGAYQGDKSSREKYGEMYTWARLIPYVQGVILYLLAISYPFVCIFILIPGWHKILFTWISFFVWAKIWDIGFAIVMVLERSIWAMLGNGPNTGRVFSRIVNLNNFGEYDLSCSTGSFKPPYYPCNPGEIPKILVGGSAGADSQATWGETLRFFDTALTVGANLQLDIANSYYLYIMSALYFSVPAIAGQIVLGAKAGAASLATSAISGYAGEAGRAAGTGRTARLTHGVSHASAVMDQQAYAKSMRGQMGEGGFAREALEYGNKAAKAGTQSALINSAASAVGDANRIASLATGSRKSALGTGITLNSKAAELVAAAGGPFNARRLAVSALSGMSSVVSGDVGNGAGSTNQNEAPDSANQTRPPLESPHGDKIQSLSSLSGAGGRGTSIGTPSGGGGRQVPSQLRGLGSAVRQVRADPWGTFSQGYRAIDRGVAQAAATMSAIVGGAGAMEGAVGSNMLDIANNMAQAQSELAQIGLKQDSMAQGQYSQAYQMAGKGMSDVANFKAALDSAQIKVGMAANAGILGAFGMDASYFSVKGLPTDLKSMAHLGTLGTVAQKSAMFTNDASSDSSYARFIAGGVQKLASTYGQTMAASYANGIDGSLAQSDWQSVNRALQNYGGPNGVGQMFRAGGYVNTGITEAQKVSNAANQANSASSGAIRPFPQRAI
jgi:hypothetical protein